MLKILEQVNEWNIDWMPKLEVGDVRNCQSWSLTDRSWERIE